MGTNGAPVLILDELKVLKTAPAEKENDVTSLICGHQEH